VSGLPRSLRRRLGRRLGISAVEIAVGATLGGSMLFAAGMMTKSAGDASNAAFHRNGLMMRSNRVMDRLCSELQMAGFHGEDENRDGLLEPGEDSNLNGVLDSAWSLPDGATANFVTFNRVENRYYWSSPITYTVRDNTLFRTEEGEDEKLICRDVSSFSVQRQGDEVIVRLTLQDMDRTKRQWSETIERRVYVRN
jgi:hypothetical protein